QITHQLLLAPQGVTQSAFINMSASARISVGEGLLSLHAHAVYGSTAEHFTQALMEIGVVLEGQLPHRLDTGLPLGQLPEPGIKARLRLSKTEFDREGIPLRD